MAAEVAAQRYLFRTAEKETTATIANTIEGDDTRIRLYQKSLASGRGELVVPEPVHAGTAESTRTEPDPVFQCNPLHDVESLLWIHAYFTTRRDVQVPLTQVEITRRDNQRSNAERLFSDRRTALMDEAGFSHFHRFLHPSVQHLGGLSQNLLRYVQDAYKAAEREALPCKWDGMTDIYDKFQSALFVAHEHFEQQDVDLIPWDFSVDTTTAVAQPQIIANAGQDANSGEGDQGTNAVATSAITLSVSNPNTDDRAQERLPVISEAEEEHDAVEGPSSEADEENDARPSSEAEEEDNAQEGLSSAPAESRPQQDQTVPIPQAAPEQPPSSRYNLRPRPRGEAAQAP